jgi:ArsR family transcriptional regulator
LNFSAKNPAFGNTQNVIKELKNAGIIKGNIDGNSICYCIDEKTIEILNTYFSKIVETVSKSKCC